MQPLFGACVPGAWLPEFLCSREERTRRLLERSLENAETLLDQLRASRTVEHVNLQSTAARSSADDQYEISVISKKRALLDRLERQVGIVSNYVEELRQRLNEQNFSADIENIMRTMNCVARLEAQTNFARLDQRLSRLEVHTTVLQELTGPAKEEYRENLADAADQQLLAPVEQRESTLHALQVERQLHLLDSPPRATPSSLHPAPDKP